MKSVAKGEFVLGLGDWRVGCLVGRQKMLDTVGEPTVYWPIIGVECGGGKGSLSIHCYPALVRREPGRYARLSCATNTGSIDVVLDKG